MNNKKNNKGFTLMESIIYVGIVSVILVSVAEFHFSLGGTTSKLAANIEVASNRRTTLNTIEYLIRNSDGILRDTEGHCSNFTPTSSRLALYFENDTYLPGFCVSPTGGGLEIKVSTTTDRVILLCRPNIVDNGGHEVCAKPVGNTYYLTSPNVKVDNESGLRFSVSEVEGFPSISTILKVGSIATEERYLTAESEAINTVSLRNEHRHGGAGLVAWWKMNEVDPVNSIFDSARNHASFCEDGIVNAAGLINNSTSSNDFQDGINYCKITDVDDLNFNDGFTLVAWIKRESDTGNRQDIFNKWDSSDKRGYGMYLASNRLYCVLCDGQQCVEPYIDLTNNDKSNFVACIYKKRDNILWNYIYEEGDDSNYSATASTSVDMYLVNADKDLYIGNSRASTTTNSNYFIGSLDEVRLFKRALKAKEIEALQTQGKEEGGR